MQKTILVVTGPTASGKTDKAIELALEHGSPVISADSRQVFRELSIGVARPTEEQLAKVPHYLVAHASIHEPYNAGIYANEGRLLINRLFDTHDTLVVCGGTGLYIQALLEGLDPLPGRNGALRQELNGLLEREGLQPLQDMLRRLNPVRLASMDIQNPQRLIRAIEIERSEMPVQSLLPEFSHPFTVRTIVMEHDREALYGRINRRVVQMIEEGLENEVRALLPYSDLNALQTVGYSEWWPYFRGECDLDTVIALVQQHTRNYAKRQLTWIRNRM